MTPDTLPTADTQQDATLPYAPAIWEKAFFKVLRHTGNVSEACAAAKIERSTAYRRRDDNEIFKALWDDARKEASDWLEKEAWRRAMKGVRQPVFQGGILVGHKQEYSDTLLVRLMEANNPDKFKRRTDITSGDEKLPTPTIYLPEVQDEP